VRSRAPSRSGRAADDVGHKRAQKTRFKRFKITPDDWRKRKKSPAYEQAVCDMIKRTSTTRAPWTLVEGEDKRFARVKVLREIVERLENQLGKG